MKTFLKIIGITTVVGIVGVLIVGAVAFAQGPQTDGFSPQNFASMRGGQMDSQMVHQMHGGRSGIQMDGMMNEDMEEIMHDAIADALGMTEADLEAQMDAGKTMFDIAAEQGVDVSTVWDVMQSARADAMQLAVNDGLITQEQVDWMAQRGAGMMSGDAQTHSRMGGHGHGNQYDGECPYDDTTN